MLVRRCVAGDAAAWEEIVQTYNRRIYNICYRFAGSSDDAEDLAQEVFIKMYRTLSSYDSSKGAFVTWVTTITRNLLVDHKRADDALRSAQLKLLADPQTASPLAWAPFVLGGWPTAYTTGTKDGPAYTTSLSSKSQGRH